MSDRDALVGGGQVRTARSIRHDSTATVLLLAIVMAACLLSLISGVHP